LTRSGSSSWVVDAADAGKTLAALVREQLGVSWSQARRYVQSGKVFVAGQRVTDIAARPRPGETIELHMNARRPEPEGPAVGVVHDDPHVVVIDKPAGVSSVPYERRETGTAMDLLRAAWRRGHGAGNRSRRSGRSSRVPLHVVHRIDKATSGLLMFAKSKRAEIGLARQLREHSVDRAYLCVVHGQLEGRRAGHRVADRLSSHAAPALSVTVTPGASRDELHWRIESRLVRDRGDGLRGSTRHGNQGKRSITHVHPLEILDRTTLCRVELETGRTHQIRIHLAELGHPLVGETVYKRDHLDRGGELIPSPRLLLHAATLGFEHPITGESIALESPLPDDFVAVMQRLGLATD